MELNMFEINKLIATALAEDMGTGDITTNSIVPSGSVARGIIYVKEPGVVAGIPVARAVFHYLAPDIVFTARVKEGDTLAAGEVIAEVSGDARAILTGERLALNFLQRMSGIATRTAALVEKVKLYPVRVVDTRKTTPGLRMLEKYAVRVGGGFNHRFGLYDAVLIKDNHIKVAGGITQAILAARQNVPHTVKIEVEVENLAGVQEALEARADVIMLDNMDPVTMREAVKMIDGRALVEASGGIGEETITAVAKAGVDLISIGALTHSVKALDISLDIGDIKQQNRT
ncbi:carboxylating nicotinate-nucleotide diphosphorylase [Desulforamulus hydrothermalis]|uniref:Probable nicotinate-nucleotide pyrophosphorylase [carboxylating] n=1 Tax=Desulforamulus hydrothermalis Lam5 = DSM 18033 TaxID=1121428 RepID=K8EJB2_9FIRM|nr:carboxylating nicotinate-nucleotide diphosphorylase [Desulforamulus hydrothermalis]CCO08681.1 putative nicotinate-nucleotide pyrophosphorylase (carboxylating) [Desulforamulus hydrothermalis Lam5 = DSM 18033]SHH38653.1 nicotinate-nucleotide pyrophosphorylase [carboxylating] [Desulforamulus hydrothermalis Lam5 = DSM 18033]